VRREGHLAERCTIKLVNASAYQLHDSHAKVATCSFG
jgi:hypothetical protein